MSKKNIGHLEYVDKRTGEVLQHIDKVYTAYSESFIMIRTTEGLDWYYPLGKNEKSLVLMLHEWSDSESMRLSLQVWQRDLICARLGISRRQISILLKSLEKSNCIKRLSQNDFLVNPSHANKCGTKQWRKRIEKYNSISRGRD